MDIEWAIADGEIAILQARPITALPAAPLKNVVWKPPTPKTVWMRRQIVEHMPEPLSPLFEDLYLKQGLVDTVNDLLVTFGSVADVRFDLETMMPHGFADTINGYAYTTMTANLNAENIIAVLKVYPRILRLLKMPAFDWEGHVLPNYQALIARWDALDLNSAESAAFLQGIREMAAADSGYWFGSAAYLGLSRILDPVFDKLLKTVFRAGLPQADLGSSAFLRGFDSKALDAQADMERIADTVCESASLREVVLNTSTNQLQTALANHPNGQPVLVSINAYIAAYGHQIYNLDFVAPTQGEDPQPIFLSLKALVKNAPAQPMRMRQAQMAAERDALVAQTAQALNPASRRLFEWVWKWTKQFGPYREHVMFYMGAAWPTVRKLAHELGQRLTAAGVIAQPDDIYYLESSEIEVAINARANGSTPNFAERVQARRELRESRKLLTPQPKVPVQSALGVGPFKLTMFDPTPPEAAGNDGPVLNGYAVSMGRVTAPASVIHSIADFDKMQDGSILVCTTTTPAWTPLFSQAAGLVTDVGGALAHGSIVAREYGIPAVMGTGVATERIKSGMMLAIDGDKGTVTLVDEVDEVALARAEVQKMAEAQRAGRRKTAVFVAIAGLIAGLLWWKRRK
jgi:pyruvate,water dikinase